MRNLLVFIIILCSCLVGVANDIRISNTVLSGQDTAANTISVRFDIQWENSWRTSAGPGNWDAAWVFVKYRLQGSSTWHHAYLAGQGHTPGSGAALELGLKDPASPFNQSNNPALGTFIYRSTEGDGLFSAAGVTLKWDYGANGLPDNAGEVEIKVFGIEMVLVPNGNFYLGSGGTETNRFHSGGNANGAFLVTGEQEIGIGTGSGQLYYTSDNEYAGDRQGPVPTAFPKGFKGFYAMKYEISQQQYADFLNTLNARQLDIRLNQQDFSTFPGYIFELQRTDTGFVAQRPNSACNFISVYDALAYSDWAGLRPMSEMEFEKAARGSLAPIPNEYAWGDTTLAKAAYTLSNFGAVNEQIASNYQMQAGNAAYSTTTSTTTPEAGRAPYRVGIFAGNPQNNGRRSAGSSYWGAMELSGSLYEYCVTAGSPAGREFAGQHGDGSLDSLGNHNEPDWAGDAAAKYSLRGGAWSYTPGAMRTSDREFGGRLLFAPNLKRANRGYRGVRTAGGAVTASLPSVTTKLSSFSSFQTITGGIVSSDGGAPVTARGVIWGTEPGLTIALGTKTQNGSGLGEFTDTIRGLLTCTKYYLRAYATNSAGTAYGTELTFTTGGTFSIITAPVSSITTSTATIGGTITSSSCVTVTSRGLVWGTVLNPTVALSTKTENGSGSGSFTSEISGLNPGTTYYVRAYVFIGSSTNPIYSANRSFTTLSGVLPSVTTAPLSEITATTAMSGGTVSSEGGAAVTARGVVWSTSANPNISLPTKTIDGAGLGAFSSVLSGLLPGTRYYMRAYARNNTGTAYGEEVSFETMDSLAVVSTAPITDIRTKSAIVSSILNSDGGSEIAARGIVWNTLPNPTVNLQSKSVSLGGVGTITDTLRGLQPGTRYYVRAYATNSLGTAYGNELTFETYDGCGAYIAPGEWKEFMCHNLGVADTNADPFTQSWEINGGYWQWGRPAMAAPGPSGPDLPNSLTIPGWNGTDAQSGSWSDSSKTVNDPCPVGYRVPSIFKWRGVLDNNQLFFLGAWGNSPTNFSCGISLGDALFLPVAGSRDYNNGELRYRGEAGYYWSSSQDDLGNAGYLFILPGATSPSFGIRSIGFSLRCVAE